MSQREKLYIFKEIPHTFKKKMHKRNKENIFIN
mgnify:FL=1|jgi:hypothetical protein